MLDEEHIKANDATVKDMEVSSDESHRDPQTY